MKEKADRVFRGRRIRDQPKKLLNEEWHGFRSQDLVFNDLLPEIDYRRETFFLRFAETATLLERSLCRLNYDLRFHFIRQLSFLLFSFFEITPSTIHHPLCHCSPSGRIPFTRGDVIFRGTKR